MDRVGNKNPLKPPHPYNSLHLSHILKGWRALHLIKQLLGQHISHLTKGLPKPIVVLDLEFSVDSPPVPPAKPAECPIAEASLHMLTLYHQCNGPVYSSGKKENRQVSGYHP